MININIQKKKTHYYKILNFDHYLEYLKKEIYSNIKNLDNIKFLLPISGEYTKTEFNRLIRKQINIKFPNNYNILCYNYYLVRGFDEQVAKEEISKHKRKMSIFCVEYYLVRGYTEQAAKEEISKLQSKISKNAYKKNLSKNPNYSKEKSFTCKEYWIKRGYSEDEAEEKRFAAVHNHLNKGSARARKENPNHTKQASVWSKEHWIKRGYSEEESEEKISYIQTTNTLEKYIEKYGEIEGREKFEDRQKRWQETLNSKSQEEINDINKRKIWKSGGVSKQEQLLASILNDAGFKLETQVTLKNYIYDIKIGNCLIEYNGGFWHNDPRCDWMNPVTKKTYKETSKKDNKKITTAIELGYNIIEIWEYDFQNNKEQTMEFIKEFINGRNN